MDLKAASVATTGVEIDDEAESLFASTLDLFSARRAHLKLLIDFMEDVVDRILCEALRADKTDDALPVVNFHAAEQGPEAYDATYGFRSLDHGFARNAASVSNASPSTLREGELRKPCVQSGMHVQQPGPLAVE